MRHKLRKFNYHLTLNDKFLVVSLFFCFIFTFFPWFGKIGLKEEIISNFAYSGIAAIMGWFFAFFIIIALIFNIITITNNGLGGLIKKHYWLYLFLTGESLFLLILTALVYTSYAMQFSQAGVKYGLILAIIANIVALFSSHFFYLQNKKNELKKKLVSQMQTNVHLETDDIKSRTDNQNPHRFNKNTYSNSSDDQQMTLSDYVNN